jgi:glucokinase
MSSMSQHNAEARPPLRWVADIGGSHVTAAVIDVTSVPRVRDRETAVVATQGSAEEILGSMTRAMLGVAKDARNWTIALPGPFDYERGIGSFEGVAKFAAIAGVDLRENLSSMLGVSASQVRFINDAVAYGVGEWSASASRPERFVCITLGTGIGSAFLDNGRPVDTGPQVPPNGWAHLLEIKGAPLEDSVSTRAIQRRYASGGGEDLFVRDIAERARNGEALARGVLDEAMFELGEALRPWIARFKASETVIGGSMARSWDVLGGAFERGVRSRTGTVGVRASRLFDDAPLIGAALFH